MPAHKKALRKNSTWNAPGFQSVLRSSAGDFRQVQAPGLRCLQNIRFYAEQIPEEPCGSGRRDPRLIARVNPEYPQRLR